MVALTEQQYSTISQIIQHTYEQQCIRPCDIKRVEAFRDYLERLCQVSLNCCLDIFGSTKNGFGTRNSDVDLCLHLDPYSLVTQHFVHRQSRNISLSNIPYNAAVLLGLAYELHKTKSFKKLTAILTARVPVLKISCDTDFNGVQADLTICNEVAIHNTRLLQSYGRLDKRVPQLGVALKVWMKCCNISGASEGWLSSYAYIIMLVHFLQRIEKPVLPFLQQVSLPTKPKKPMLIGEWDVYFYNPDEMVWLAPNSQSVAELWLDFFAYYAWKFDFENEVVQIRHPRVLMKKSKGWESSSFAVEDPFVLNHNLAASVDSEALSHIKETFALTYYHFVSGFFLRCGKELDLSHAKSLYRKCEPPGHDIVLKARCSVCSKDCHVADTCPIRDTLSRRRVMMINAPVIDKEENSGSSSEIDINSSNDSGLFSLGFDSDALLFDESRSVLSSDGNSIDSQETSECTSDCGGVIEESLDGFEPVPSGLATRLHKTKKTYAFDPNMVLMVRRRSFSNLTTGEKEVVLLPYTFYNELENSFIKGEIPKNFPENEDKLESHLSRISLSDAVVMKLASSVAQEHGAEGLPVAQVSGGTGFIRTGLYEDYSGLCVLPPLLHRFCSYTSQRLWNYRSSLIAFPLSLLEKLLVSLSGVLRKFS